MEFAPCSMCRRHVRVDEPACPFCGATLREQPVHRSLIGRASRAAVFASAAALAGCYTSSTGTTTTGGGPPPPDETASDVRFAKPPQADRGAISGIVKDWNGRPAANHRLDLQGATEHRDTTTDARGAYSFGDLPPGSYSITYQRSNHPRHPPYQQQVDVVAGTNTRIDLALQPPPPPDRGPCCKPYGAPPARRRLV